MIYGNGFKPTAPDMGDFNAGVEVKSHDGLITVTVTYRGETIGVQVNREELLAAL